MKRSVTALFIVCAAIRTTAQDNYKTVQKAITKALKGHELVFVTPYSSPMISFSWDGSCVTGCIRGGWDHDGSILFKNVRIDGSGLDLTGDRLVIFHDEAGARNAIRLDQKVEVKIALNGEPTLNSASAVLFRAFRPPNEAPPNAIPPDPNHPEGPFEEKPEAHEIRRKGSGEWQRIANFPDAVVVGRFPDGSPAYLVTKVITPPKPIKTPDPPYSEADRKAHRTGSVKFRIAVDDHGFVRGMQVLHSDWKGFVTPAAVAISQWQFRPASYDGNPVACVISVEVNFRLY